MRRPLVVLFVLVAGSLAVPMSYGAPAGSPPAYGRSAGANPVETRGDSSAALSGRAGRGGV